MSFDKTAIEEANKHLLALSQRVVELDEIVKQQAMRLENIDAENQAKIDAVVQHKDAEILKQNAWLQSTQAEIRRLNIEVINKDVTISQLKEKASILDKAMRYRSELEGLLRCFSELDTLQAAASGSRSSRPHSVNTQQRTRIGSDLENREKEESSESSLSEEEFSDNEQQSNVVWTPKGKIQPDNNGLQSLSLNGKKLYTPPSKVPGSAVKNANETDMKTEPEQATTSDEASNLQSRDGILANYETQL